MRFKDTEILSSGPRTETKRAGVRGQGRKFAYVPTVFSRQNTLIGSKWTKRQALIGQGDMHVQSVSSCLGPRWREGRAPRGCTDHVDSDCHIVVNYSMFHLAKLELRPCNFSIPPPTVLVQLHVYCVVFTT